MLEAKNGNQKCVDISLVSAPLSYFKELSWLHELKGGEL